MASGSLSGRAQTVLGPVAPEGLGITLMHEHLLVDLRRVFDEPADARGRALSRQQVTLSNLAWVTKNWASSLDNLVLDDPELAAAEVMLFKDAGGGTIVDVNTADLVRHPPVLRDISRRCGVNIVMGCGYYHAGFHPADMAERSEEELADEIAADILVGVDGTGIRAGIIGEVGCSWPLHPNEAKSLRASARAQRETGAAITIHPGRHVDAPFEILDVLERAGADPARVVMGHIERTGFDADTLLRLARRGCCLEYDWFGEVRPAYPHGRVDVPSDGERIREIAFLIAAGHGSQVVVSHDVCFKMRLAAYGGPGYEHIPRYVAEWMRAMGIAGDEVRRILIENPRRILAFP
ncbi:MAG: hypothetical protein KJZ85_10830 [Rhodobacteraceae bacterium]|jgi:phosphotriesterase-related protein|nr:hypothetical protein [Paracoccaceae bacterium]